MRSSRRGALAGGAAWLAARSAYAADYDPTTPGPQSRAADHHYDLVVQDPARQRAIPIAITHAARRIRMPVILFSHGLGGNRHNPVYLQDWWTQRGYVCVFLQHPGSDDAVWRDTPPAERMAALRKAATITQLVHRMRDVVAVLDALAAWQAADTPRLLAATMDLGRIGLAGHSFGAATTQAVAGQRVPPIFPGAWPDPRIKAALILSPNAPATGSPDDAFSQVAIPWMLMTGTHDTSFIGQPTNRLAVYPALPPGQKYELVLDQAEHSVFSDTALPGERLQRNPNHHRAIKSLSAAFWDSTLGANPAAAAWLNGDTARSVLEAGDRWQRK